MSAPLKRICRQAVRQASQCRSQSTTPRSLPESLQCHTRPSWKPSIQQQRAFSHSSPQPQRREEIEQNEDETYDPIDEVLSSLPSPHDLSSTAHAELAQHQELREMVRVAAWEMPLLTPLAKTPVPATRQETPLRWRYTTYFGESHPAANKVVVEFKVASLPDLEGWQRDKLRKICGVRFHPERDLVRMSCESFDSQAGNKRYLGEVIAKLMKECRDAEADSFEDVPMDLRHVKERKVFKFPKEWEITKKRRVALEEKRKQLLLAEGRKIEENSVVSGAAAIEAARQIKLAQVEQAVMAEARLPLPKGKMGPREMGQQGGAKRPR